MRCSPRRRCRRLRSQRWSVWAAGYGGSQTTDGNAAVGSNTTTSSIYGTAVGADYRFSPFTLAGFALAGGGTNFSLANGLGSGRSDLFQAGAYRAPHRRAGLYLRGAGLWLAGHHHRSHRDHRRRRPAARRSSTPTPTRAASKAAIALSTPWMGGSASRPMRRPSSPPSICRPTPSRRSSGANTFALDYAAKSVTDTRSELGFRTDKSYAMQDGILTLRGRFAWAHDFDPDRNIAATFQTLPGASLRRQRRGAGASIPR